MTGFVGRQFTLSHLSGSGIGAVIHTVGADAHVIVSADNSRCLQLHPAAT
jgi:hypothetical protein